MSRPATRFYVVTARCTPVDASSPASACRKVERTTPRRGALIGSSFAVASPAEAEYVVGNLANVGKASARVVIEVRG